MFAYEFAKRCSLLLDGLEGEARKGKLLETFSILMASTLLTVPLDRLRAHPMSPIGSSEIGNVDRMESLKDLEKHPFINSALSEGFIDVCSEFHKAKITRNIAEQSRWVNKDGLAPHKAPNEIGSANVGRVLRILRNALSHGNVVYLNDNWREESGHTAVYLGFVSLGENQTEEFKSARKSKDFRSLWFDVIYTTSESLVVLLRNWVKWLESFAENDYGYWLGYSESDPEGRLADMGVILQ